MQGYSIIRISTGEKVNKSVVFAQFYHATPEVLLLFTKPVTEDGDILVEDYKLQPRDIPDTKKSEDEVINEKAIEFIRKTGVAFLFNHKLATRENVITFTYDKLLDTLVKFGKTQIFDRKEDIDRKIEQSFV